MEIIDDIGAMQAWSQRHKQGGRTVGVVPTMGALHTGHLSLVEVAGTHCDEVVVTLFVNPTQFGPNEDFAAYPRTMERDLALCRERGVAAVFTPAAATMYCADASVVVAESTLSRRWCGAARPGHFGGVCTVVAKLFNATLPDVAVFGQKDYQQAAIIRRMVRDLNFPVAIVVAPIVRDADGLALSSRNAYLSVAERTMGLGLSQALALVRTAWQAGERDAGAVMAQMTALMQGRGLRIDYVAIVDAATLEPVAELAPGVVVLLAAYAGKTRLIDNEILQTT